MKDRMHRPPQKEEEEKKKLNNGGNNSPETTAASTITHVNTRTDSTKKRAKPTPLKAYAYVWSLHTLLQLYSQAFLFDHGNDNQTRLRLWMLLAVAILLARPNRLTLGGAILARNVVRWIRVPFVWDSEFWLCLTDVSVLVSLCRVSPRSSSPTTTSRDGWRLPGVSTNVQAQFGVCYMASAFFKVNTSFLSAKTSCASIFGLSILGRLPEALTRWLVQGSLSSWFLQGYVHVLPWIIIIIEALVGLGLLYMSRTSDFFGCRCHRATIVLALIFHAAIAVTPPPNGVPTFSCVVASRLLLCCIDDNRPERMARAVLFYLKNPLGWSIGIFSLVGYNADLAVVLYFQLMAMVVLAFPSNTNLIPKNKPNQPNDRAPVSWLLFTAAVVYAFVLPILGVQEIGSCTMFANARLIQNSNPYDNNLLWPKVPTGLFQAWEIGPYKGGIVRVTQTNSQFLNELYPGEITSLLSVNTRSLLWTTGHATRQFNPKARRVLGPVIRAGMPRWSDNSTQYSFVPYTVPSLELRRMVQEALQVEAKAKSWKLVYTRLAPRNELHSTVELWRHHGHGREVVLTVHDSGKNSYECQSYDQTGPLSELESKSKTKEWVPCNEDELIHLGLSSSCTQQQSFLSEDFWSQWTMWAALKMGLFYPLPLVPEVNTEIVCNY